MTAPNVYQRVILAALNRTGKHIYGGAESPAERAERRRADKAEANVAQLNRRQRRAYAQATRKKAA
jgi:hypothetical protein